MLENYIKRKKMAANVDELGQWKEEIFCVFVSGIFMKYKMLA